MVTEYSIQKLDGDVFFYIVQFLLYIILIIQIFLSENKHDEMIDNI